MDPFDPANPMDHEDIAGHMKHYWNLNYKHAKKEEGQQGKIKYKDWDEEDTDEISFEMVFPYLSKKLIFESVDEEIEDN